MLDIMTSLKSLKLSFFYFKIRIEDFTVDKIKLKIFSLAKENLP